MFLTISNQFFALPRGIFYGRSDVIVGGRVAVLVAVVK